MLAFSDRDVIEELNQFQRVDGDASPLVALNTKKTSMGFA